MNQLVIHELRRTSNIPGLEKTKMVMVLCYLHSVSSTSVRFDSSAPPFAFSIFLHSLSHFLRSPTLFPSCFLLNVTSPPSLFFFCPLRSVLLLAYSQRTRVFLVSQRASWWRGFSATIRSLLDLELAPLSLQTSPSFIITKY